MADELTKEDKVFLALEILTSKNVSSVVDEARNYCFKCMDGSIHTIDRDFVDEYLPNITSVKQAVDLKIKSGNPLAI